MGDSPSEIVLLKSPNSTKITMSIALRLLAPALLSFAVACGAASAEGQDEDEPETTSGTAAPSASASATTAVSTTESKPWSASLTATGDVAPESTPETPSAGEASTELPAPEPIALPTGLRFRGVNLAGAEFSGSVVPGIDQANIEQYGKMAQVATTLGDAVREKVV